MYDLEQELISINGVTEKITDYEVWFQIPFAGVFTDRQEAINILKDMDLDPKQCLVPIPVAVSGTLYEILVK